MAHPRRRGFALVAVLWTLAGVSVMSMALALAARTVTHLAINRVTADRARWHAEGCVSLVRARWDSALAVGHAPEDAWRELDRVVLADPLDAGCRVTVRPVGSAADVNRVDAWQLHILLSALGQAPPARDSLVAAMLDWRDADSDERPSGAEAPRYDAAAVPGPRNGDFASVDELAFVRGAADVAGLDTLLGIDSARVVLGHAPALVLRTVEGIDAEFAAAIVAARGHADTVDLDQVAAAVSPQSRARFLGRRGDVLRAVTNVPTRWVVSAAAPGGAGWIPSVEVTFARHDRRVAVVRVRR